MKRLPSLLSAGMVILLALTANPTAPLTAEKPALAKPSYVTLLRLPYRQDRLGISRGVTADPITGEVFVCDWRHGRIVIFDEALLFRFMMSGARFTSSPIEVAVDPNGFLLVLPSADAPMTYLDFDGAFLGEVSLVDLPDNLPSPARITSVALSPAGDTIYAVDSNNLRVWLAGRDGKVHGSINLGEGRDEKESADLILGHVDVYQDTVLVAAPTDGSVYLYDLAGRPRGMVGQHGTAPCQTAFPVAAALDSEGRVIIVDNQRAVVSIWEPEGNKCQLEFGGFGNAPGRFYRPQDLTLDGKGRIFVSQGFEGRVQIYQHSSPAAGTPKPQD